MPANSKVILSLVIASFIFLMFGNGILNLTNPDEVFYAQTAKEMAQQKTWLVPYLFGQPQFEKPVLTYWLLRIGFILFGVTGFGSRFFPALLAMAGVIAVYFFCLLAYKDRIKAATSSMVLMSAGLYIGLARTVFTDMIFSVFILFSLLSFFWAYTDAKKKAPGIILFFLFSALAVLTKGPLGFLIPFSIVFFFLVMRRDLKFLLCCSSLWGFALFAAVSLPWYILMVKRYGRSFTHEFFYNDHIRRLFEAEHIKNDTWYFYPLSMFACMFPWSLYAACAVFYAFKKAMQKREPPIYLFLASWVAVALLLFQFAHSKLVSYIFPLFPALAIATGDYLCNGIKSGRRLIPVFLSLTWLFMFSLPAGLMINAAKYPQYQPSRAGIYNFIFLYLALLAVILFYILKRRFLVAVYLSSLPVLFCLFFVLSAHKNFSLYVSSKETCDYLLKNYKIENTILCSRSFLRGTRFYSDKEVAVICTTKSYFFSPHPVLYLDSDEKVADFFKKQGATYCVLTKSYLSTVRTTAENNKLKLELLQVIGNQYIARVTSLKP